MGYIPANLIERAGHHLLSILRTETSVRYSRFYDGSEETSDLLHQALGLDDDWYSAELLVDIAAEQLRNAGVATLISLPDRVADGEHDYSIMLTDKGESLLRSRSAFQFFDVDA